MSRFVLRDFGFVFDFVESDSEVGVVVSELGGRVLSDCLEQNIF